MSRWRPPSEKSSPYITAEGHARLKAEFEQLWRVRRPEVVRALSAAAAEGDRSENAEYQYRKKELREIDARLKYLTTRLSDVKVVEPNPKQTDRAYFGAWLEVADEEGESRHYRIVGADETDSGRGWISVDSPVARALLGKAVGELVKIRLPAGEVEYELLAVRYER
ncbi:transcription elongation factor GreB [Solimonas aquatica]|uniref:Transcription elongation factor GreB n=1 Tax=Solimonas aquatica TaxID=489703 RepID=A0A1H8ZGK6_9GAMM|nr:transcription elongation factor GreB [Solimonas aquatica]SEP63473.1 transcription elongation factor GreB [Solimonas aquatica]